MSDGWGIAFPDRSRDCANLQALHLRNVARTIRGGKADSGPVQDGLAEIADELESLARRLLDLDEIEKSHDTAACNDARRGTDEEIASLFQPAA